MIIKPTSFEDEPFEIPHTCKCNYRFLLPLVVDQDYRYQSHLGPSGIFSFMLGLCCMARVDQKYANCR